ncbi:MAG: carboxymuconolactone decarboxylase family protein [Phycisphaerales bacterium]
MHNVKAAAPEVVRAFGTFFQSLMREGALTVREKELVALGIGLAARCEGCIFSHVEKCLKAGATCEQILEVAGVAVMMGGGPTYTYLPKIVEALDHFAEQSSTTSAV